VLDEWFERDARVRLKGNSILVRDADDSVMAFENLDDARRVMDVLGKRLARYGLTLHPAKTHLVDFRFHRPGGVCHPDTDSATFNFLGFSHKAFRHVPWFTPRATQVLTQTDGGKLAAASG
jgi:RNA-directed DNA polymerase